MNRDLALGAGRYETGVAQARPAAVQPGLRHEPGERAGQAEIRLHRRRGRANLEAGWRVRAEEPGQGALAGDALGVSARRGARRWRPEDAPGTPGRDEVRGQGVRIEARQSPRPSS